MSRSEFPRIYEIRDALRIPNHPNTYFKNFEELIASEEVVRKHFLHIESDLAGLDAVAWKYLKSEVVPLFEKKHSTRGWQAAFDKLNQSKAYNYLTKLGCKNVEFIPESIISGQKTPDLQGSFGGRRILCEVKTINPSDDEAAARIATTSRDVQGTLPDAFFAKLTSALRTAETQMRSFDSNAAYRMAYFVLNFDDNLHQYVEDYVAQVQNFVACAELPRIKIVIDVKPKFYSATSASDPPQVFVCSPGK